MFFYYDANETRRQTQYDCGNRKLKSGRSNLKQFFV